MRLYGYLQFDDTMRFIRDDFLNDGDEVNTSQWNSTDQNTDSVELPFVTIEYAIPTGMGGLQMDVKPNLPWAEDHFKERVGGQPVNPPPSSAWWPYAQAGHEHWVADGGKFSHSYPERMWAEEPQANLAHLILLMQEHRGTRQGYFPIWWPKDGILAGGERVPCTLGYHFIERDGMLHCHYFMRSCDFMRYLRDDVYLTARLMQWVAEKLGLEPGMLHMQITSLHCFAGDIAILKNQIRNERYA